MIIDKPLFNKLRLPLLQGELSRHRETEGIKEIRILITFYFKAAYFHYNNHIFYR